MDFLIPSVRVRKNQKGESITEIYPNFKVRSSKDLMIRGKDFYAIWDEANGRWSTDQDVALDLIDREVSIFAEKKRGEISGPMRVLHTWDSASGVVDKWKHYIQKQMPDCYHQLDDKLIFANTESTREDYSSHRLSYPLKEAETPCYTELMTTIYDPEELHKIEWAIGAIVSGDSKHIQKFMVFVGDAGTGKSTVMKIIRWLFDGYCATVDAKALGSSNAVFALEALKGNPLVAIQDDADLSRIEDNTRLNSLVSHEYLTVNEKFKSQYETAFHCFLFLGTNKEVMITDARSGLLRRLIDVAPSGRKVPIRKYRHIMNQIQFELGGIAAHCLKVYQEDPYAYESYFPAKMIRATNTCYNFVEENSKQFIEQNGVTLKAAWALYNEFCLDGKVPYPLSKQRFKNELMPYFKTFISDGHTDDGAHVYNYYSGFRKEKIGLEKSKEKSDEKESSWLEFDCTKSIFDYICADCPAQYGSQSESPEVRWDEVKTKLKDLATTKLHYVRVPQNHIVIDFDIKDEEGNKSYEANLEAANKFPPTYAELSKSGAGIHLHYIYDGDVSKLSRVYGDSIEVKVFTGKSSLRRKLTRCNDLGIATINSGLPLKGVKNMVNMDVVQTEKGLRTTINKCIRKEIHPGTKPNVDFIFKILEDAYNSDLAYDVTDLRPKILAFANNSTHHSKDCIKLVGKMHFKAKQYEEESKNTVTDDNASIIFFDVEVFPNLFVCVWKLRGSGNPVKMINPTPTEIEELLKFRLVGFNNRRYDNHILYARMMGYTNAQLYDLSQRLINNSQNATFGEAYNLSYTDIYDFCSKKQSLKKWEIELGIHHQELGLPWDKPVDESLWEKVADYCVNDVVATEATFEARQQDFIAREILSDISGLTVNDTSNQQTAKIIFGDDPHPQDQFVYTDLSTIFPGYTFDHGKSSYMGEEPGEGGYVYSEPGMYGNVALLDIASMHPTSLIQLNLFGKYTSRFKDLLDIRLHIKHKEYDEVKKMFDGKLAKYLTSEEQAEALSYALKIVINSVYGLTSASFPNKFKDPRNKDNIVAKRGSLFMINLKNEVQKRGYTVAHIKTDSIKIPDADTEIINFVMDYGKKYGYNFEHEATYDKMCLVNDAVYIARYKGGKHAGEWTATGAQFQQPYVFKTLFSKEPIEFKDMCETKTVSSALYLDMNEGLKEEEHNYVFVGKAGQFCPIKNGCGGGILLREKDGKYYAATGSKGYRWLESEVVRNAGKIDDIDRSYYISLVDAAVNDISKYGDFEWFASEDYYSGEFKKTKDEAFVDMPEPLPWE